VVYVHEDISVDDLTSLAANHGLNLSHEEAQRALDGANRWRKQVLQLRALVTRTLEPASVFRAPQRETED